MDRDALTAVAHEKIHSDLLKSDVISKFPKDSFLNIYKSVSKLISSKDAEL